MIFLDDCPSRTRLFSEKYPDAKCVETAEDAVSAIRTREDEGNPYTLFLDHDLGGETDVDSSRPDTGMEVVRVICREHPRMIQRIVVHTMNGKAAPLMMDALLGSGYNVERIPFLTLERTLY